MRNGSSRTTSPGSTPPPPPEGKATFLLWEGDANLSGGGESLVFNGTTLSDALNPANNPYNSTINSLGVSTSYGVDLDTFDVSGTIAARDTLASMTINTGPDLVILNAVLLAGEIQHHRRERLRGRQLRGRRGPEPRHGRGGRAGVHRPAAGGRGRALRRRRELPADHHDGCERPIRVLGPARRRLHRARAQRQREFVAPRGHGEREGGPDVPHGRRAPGPRWR